MLGEIPGETGAITAAISHYNPEHRWWYFTNMHRDEVIKACRVPHTAFRDPSFPDAHPRASIEFRTFAYFN